MQKSQSTVDEMQIDSPAPVHRLMSPVRESSIEHQAEIVNKRKKQVISDSEDEEAQPVGAMQTDKEISQASEQASEQEEQPIKHKKKKLQKKNQPKKKLKKDQEVSVRQEASPQKGSPKQNKTEDEEDNTYKWWEQEELDDSVKWTTLEHHGPMFPPAYIPHGVKMLYDGQEVDLSPESEEVAGFFSQMLETPYVENETFVKNFFADFMQVLRKNDPQCIIEAFDLCDFRPMKVHFDALRDKRKAMTKEEKQKLKAEKAEIDKVYGFATLDGRIEKVGNFRIEPPGLFRGRGDHPKTGSLKTRVAPEQITINIGEDAEVPAPPTGTQWGKIQHDNTVAWLATWTENISGNTKYVRFADSSSLKGMSDMKKFEKARELKKHIDAIRRDYTEELKDKLMVTRQRATVIWLIDKLALRAGNEKGEDEADTVGCCSLRYEHIELEEDEEEIPDPEQPGLMKKHVKKMVVFDFLGKDSVRYYNRIEVDPVVWKNLKIFKRPPKHEGDPIFDRLSTSLVNAHLSKLMPGLTAKVFRTYNASHTFVNELKNTPLNASVAEKILAYNRANRQVAILCNHQRAISKGHNTQIEKMSEKLLALKYHRFQVKKAMLAQDSNLIKKRPELAEPESDLDEETYARKAKDYENAEQEKLDKRHEKLCEKLRAEDKDADLPEKPVWTDKLDDISLDRLEKQFEKVSERILAAKSQLIDKDENKTTALGTSKINYIDPRITAAWAKKHDVPLEKMFTKTLREKFKWAMDADANWEF